MRTTITIDDGLLDEVRKRAAHQRTTVSRVIEDSVRESLLRRADPQPVPFTMRTFHGGVPQPGVDLDDNAALLDRMDDLG